MEATEAMPVNTSRTASEPPPPGKKFGFLPEVGSVRYHLMLSLVAIFILGPLGGIAAAYMNFSLGFFVGGQVLAGILGSAVTYGYGAEGKHGANYMQTMAASVASLAAMGVLIQAMVWLGMELPPMWQLAVFFTCVGMFGVGIGMLYTPMLVDRMSLTFPSGLAVANILRALTDKALLKNSITKLGGGIALGVLGAFLVDKFAGIPEENKLAWFAGMGGLGATLTSIVGFSATLSVSTLGAGIVVASRIAVPGLVMAAIGAAATPYLRSIHWLAEDAPFRKIGFLIGLAMILGAAIVDITLIFITAYKRFQEKKNAPAAAATLADGTAQRPLNLKRLGIWCAFWGIAVVLIGHFVIGQSIVFLSFALLLSVVFVLVNGISTGVSDSNPISSAFVIAVFLMSALGLRDPITGMIAASVLLIACSVGVDMQQDRSTGARLGSNRDIQFRYQTVGIVMGAILAVVLAQVFMAAYPVLKINTFDNPTAQVGQWQSAMTFKFVGAIRGLENMPVYQLKALGLGLVFGVVTEIARKVLHANAKYKAYVASGKVGFTVGWILDAILLSSPYALSFGGFVELPVAFWFAAGGCLTSIVNTLQAVRVKKLANKPKTTAPGEGGEEIPEDMSTLSLVGGGLIAGESIFALAVGIMGLLALAGR